LHLGGARRLDLHQPPGTSRSLFFLGQVAAALATGNTVLAKPAEQTPGVAWEAVQLLHGAGVPADAVQLVHGPGETVGAALVALRGIAGRGLHRLHAGGPAHQPRAGGQGTAPSCR
jgi:hypothetical protein